MDISDFSTPSIEKRVVGKLCFVCGSGDEKKTKGLSVLTKKDKFLDKLLVELLTYSGVSQQFVGTKGLKCHKKCSSTSEFRVRLANKTDMIRQLQEE